MEPPSYEEASLQVPAANIPPPPSYDASLDSPPTPPPTYGEAVTVGQNPFPVLTLPRTQTAAAPPPSSTGVIIYPTTQVGVSRPISTVQTHPVVVVNQPQPVPITVTYLRDKPGLVRCTQCNNVVTTKTQRTPGTAAWCTCVLLSVMGLVCGCCLIPLMMPSLQDVHHYCPLCEKELHVYKR